MFCVNKYKVNSKMSRYILRDRVYKSGNLQGELGDKDESLLQALRRGMSSFPYWVVSFPCHYYQTSEGIDELGRVKTSLCMG